MVLALFGGCSKERGEDFSSSEWQYYVKWNVIDAPWADKIKFGESGSMSYTHPSPWLATGNLGKVTHGEFVERGFTFETEDIMFLSFNNLDYDYKSAMIAFPREWVPAKIELQRSRTDIDQVYTHRIEGLAYYLGGFSASEILPNGGKELTGELQVYFKSDDGKCYKFLFSGVSTK